MRCEQLKYTILEAHISSLSEHMHLAFYKHSRVLNSLVISLMAAEPWNQILPGDWDFLMNLWVLCGYVCKTRHFRAYYMQLFSVLRENGFSCKKKCPKYTCQIFPWVFMKQMHEKKILKLPAMPRKAICFVLQYYKQERSLSFTECLSQHIFFFLKLSYWETSYISQNIYFISQFFTLQTGKKV